MKRKFVIFVLMMIIFTAALFSCDNITELPEAVETPAYTEETTVTEEATDRHEHVFSEWKTFADPTCTEAGLTKRVCFECEYTEEKPLPLIAHKLTSTVIAPDCKSDGYTLLSCDCGYKQKSEITAKLAHTYKQTVVPPTCEDEGYTEHICTVCQDSYRDSTVNANGHSYTVRRVYPTVSAKGSMTYTCHCKSSYTEYISYSQILPNAYVAQSTVLAKGIDVSRYNHKLDTNDNYAPLDWAAIKASGVDFVILKAGSTKSGIEPTFEMDYAGARDAGLEIGAYYYTYSSTLDGIRADAQSLLEWLKGKKFEYPIYFDLEDPSLEALSKSMLSEMCKTFISVLQSEGYYAGLYSNHNWLAYILDTEEMISQYEIWYARYPGTSSPVWDKEKYGEQLGMWQYSDSGMIDGFDHPFDLNYAYKNYKEIMIKWELNGFLKSDTL